MGGGGSKRSHKGIERRRRKLKLPDLPAPRSITDDDVDELDKLRANMRGTLWQFDKLLTERRNAIERKESLLFAIEDGINMTLDRGGQLPYDSDTKSERKPSAAGADRSSGCSRNDGEFRELRDVADNLNDSMGQGIAALQSRARDTKDAEGRLPQVQTVPLIRLKLFETLRNIDAESFKSYVLAHVLESRYLHLPTVYDMLGSSQLGSSDTRYRVFTLWMHEALGETAFQRGVIKIIFEYYKPFAVSPGGMRYRLALSGPYGDARIPSSYETLTDGKHGYPGAATDHRVHPWIQAVFARGFFARLQFDPRSPAPLRPFLHFFPPSAFPPFA